MRLALLGNKALGVYLRALREGRGITREDVERAIGLSVKQLGRWEDGLVNDPRRSKLEELVAFLHGSLNDVDQFKGSDIVSQEVAAALAKDRLAAGHTAKQTQTSAANQIIERLQDHPREFAAWIGYGNRLLDELDDTR